MVKYSFCRCAGQYKFSNMLTAIYFFFGQCDLLDGFFVNLKIKKRKGGLHACCIPNINLYHFLS